jgi:hypothetical protein
MTDDQHDAGASAVAAIGWALTGAALPLATAPDRVDADAVVTWLGECGWDRARLRRRCEVVHAAGARWPTPIAADRRGGLGAAQFQAAVREVLLALGLDHPAPVLRDAATPLDAGDRRLMAELPPHFGRVG